MYKILLPSALISALLSVMLIVLLVVSISVLLFPADVKADTHANNGYPAGIAALSTLVNEVLETHPMIDAIIAERDSMTAKADAAKQPLYNPNLEFDFENTDIQSSSLGFSQTIDWFDKRYTQGQVADFNHQRISAQLYRARQNLSADVLQALASFHTQQALNKLIIKRIELLQGFVGLAQQRRKNGDLNAIELSFAKLALADAKITQSRSTSQMIDSQQKLILLVGYAKKQWPEIPRFLPELKLAEKNIDNILSELPIMKIQLSSIARSKAEIKLALKKQRADPTIGFRGGREGSDNLIGINLSIPLHIRNNFNAEVDVANAELIQAEKNSMSIARNVRSKIVSSAQRYQLLRGKWHDWQQTDHENLVKQIDLIQKLWKVGEINTTDYFMQLNQTLDMQINEIELRNDLWRNWIDWLQASNRLSFWLGLSH